MPQENVSVYNSANENEEENFSINFKKIHKIIWYRRALLIKVFCFVLLFFILLTFIVPKKYKVIADIYITNTKSSNLSEINPYMLNNSSEHGISLGVDKEMNNEIEIMKSELVLDKVIRENNIVYKKKFGIIPNKKEGEFLTAKAFYNKGKILQIDNIKNTNVVEVRYTSKKPEVAYGVISSLITNYIELHKELNSEKSKADKELLEAEYNKTKKELDNKLNQAKGLPVQAITGMGNLSAMSTFSKSASRAVGNIKGQYIAGERSQLEVTEESQKLSHLATRLEWAKMVEQMSDSSKVLILTEPKQLRPFENSSPKLLVNIILGIIFGIFASLIALIRKEAKDDKLTYSVLTNDIIYDCINKLNEIEAKLYSYNPQKILVISLAQLPDTVLNSIKNIPNTNIAYYDGKKDFIDKISLADKIVLLSKIGTTDINSYKIVREIIANKQKKLLFDILI